MPGTGSSSTQTAPANLPGETSTELESEDSYVNISSPTRYLLLGLIFLVAPSAAFVYFGGLAWMRRVLRGERKGRYVKVKSDDLEK